MLTQVNISFTGEDAVTTMRNSIINLRKTGTNKLIKNYYGALRTLTCTYHWLIG